MNLSGIAVAVRPQELDAVAARLAALPGVEVAQVDRVGGRLVLVQEAASFADEVERFGAIQQTPGVASADLVCHYFGDQPIDSPDPQRALDHLNLVSDVP